MYAQIFSAIIMLTMNIGGKFLVMDLPKSIDVYFTKYYLLRIFVLFAIIYTATHDLMISLILTLIMILLLRYLLNNDSELCILNKEDFVNEKKDSNISSEEFLKAKNIVQKYLDEKYTKNIF